MGEQITVTFYRPKSIIDPTLEKVVIRTGATDVTKAYEVAVENGHNPYRNIRFSWE